MLTFSLSTAPLKHPQGFKNKTRSNDKLERIQNTSSILPWYMGT